MDGEAEKLLTQWVSIYDEFEAAYRTVYVENVEKKKRKAHVDYAHNERTNNHINSAVLHEPQAKWCIVLCLDAMISTALTENVNDQTSVAVARRTFNQHEALRNCIFNADANNPKPKRQTPSMIDYAAVYASMTLPGLYMPQPGYYLPCPSMYPPAPVFTSGGNSSDGHLLSPVGIPSIVPLSQPVLPGDLSFSQTIHIFIPLPHHLHLHPSALKPAVGSTQDHFRHVSTGSSSNSALGILKQRIVAAAAVATSAPQNPTAAAAVVSSSGSSSSSSSAGNTRKRALDMEAPRTPIAVSTAPPPPLMPTEVVPDWVPAPWQPMPGHPHPFAGLPLSLFPGMPPPAPLHMGHGAMVPKVTLPSF